MAAAFNAERYRISVYYDLAKVAVNRLAFSQGHELAQHGASAVALTPGWMRSEIMRRVTARERVPTSAGRRTVSAMREPGLWMATAGAGLVAYVVGGLLEQNAITEYDNYGGPAVLVAHGLAVVLGCVAAYQWHRQSRRQPPPNAGPTLPAWQGYGIALLSVAWLALAVATWFLAGLKSPTLMLSMLVAAGVHLAAGTVVVRQNRAADRGQTPSNV